MYPGQTDFFLNQYEGAVKRPFGYLLIDLKTTNQDNCRLRTNVLPSGFNQAGFQENIPPPPPPTRASPLDPPLGLHIDPK